MAVWLVGGFLAVVAAVSAAARFALSSRPQTVAGAEVPVAVRRHAAIWSWSGIAIGVLAAGVAALSGALGRGLMLAAPLFGVFVLAGVLAGELSVRPPTDRTRRAAVAVRRASDYIPPGLACCVAGAAVAMGALLSMTTAMGSADDLGRAGRALVRRCSAELTQSHGPWAGSFYSIPLAIVILVGLAAAVLAMRQVVRRPRPGDPGTLAADDLLRRRAARTVTAACGVLVTIPLIAVSLVTAGGLLAVSCRPGWWTVAAWALLALVPGWTTVLAWSGLAVLTPQRLDPATASA